MDCYVVLSSIAGGWYVPYGEGKTDSNMMDSGVCGEAAGLLTIGLVLVRRVI